MEESLVDLVGMLMYNEALIKNPGLFASKFGKPNLGTDLISQQYIEIDSDTVGKTKLYTMSDLAKYMSDAYDNTSLIEALNETSQMVSVSLNSSVDIKAWMNGYSFDKFQTTLNQARVVQKNYDNISKENLYNFVSEGFKKNAISGLFLVDSKAEAMAKIAALSKGSDEVYMKNLKNLREGLLNDIKRRSGGKDANVISQNIGHLVSMGLHHLVKDLKAASDVDAFVRGLDKNDIRNKHLEVLDNWFDEFKKTASIEHLGFKNTDAKKKFIKYVEMEIRSLSGGNFHHKTGNSMELANKILVRLDRDLSITDNNSKLSKNQLLQVNLSSQLDSFIASDRILNNSNMMDQGHFKKILKEAFFDNDNLSKIGYDYMDLHGKYETDMKHNGTYQNQFNINPLLRYRTNSMVLSFDGERGNYAGQIMVGSTPVSIYYVKASELTAGSQEGVLGAFNPSEFFTGRAKLTLGRRMLDSDGNQYVTVNGQKIILRKDSKGFKEGTTEVAHIKPDSFLRSKLDGDMTEAADFSIHTQVARNQAIVELRRIKHEVRQRAIQIGLDSGVLITDQEYNSSGTNKSLYYELDNAAIDTGEQVKGNSNNAEIRSSYGKLYFEKRFVADIEGTQGVRLDKAIDKVFGHGAGQYITEFTRLAMGARDFVKTTLLLYSPGGWINSAFSSMSIYMANAKPGQMLKDAMMVEKMMKTYDVAAKQYSVALSDSKSTSADIAKARKNLEATDMYVAMSHGMSLTIRTDAFSSQTYKDNPISALISELSGSKSAGEAFKTLQLDPSVPMGARIGEYYDKLEVKPKLMLYVNGLDTFNGDKQKAAQKAVMANPQYARNLAGFANVIDQVSPYTKFFVSWPTMFLYTGKTSPGKMAALYVSYKVALWASWNAASDELTPEELRMWNEGYFKIPGIDAAKYTQSAFNYNLPSKSITEFSIIDATFFPNTVDSKHLFTPFLNYNSGWRWTDNAKS